MISAKSMIVRMSVRLELYINLIVVPLAVYYAAIAGRYHGEQLYYLIWASIISASAAMFFGVVFRTVRLSGIIRELNAHKEDLFALKLRILLYPRFEGIIITLRWVLGILCCYLIVSSKVAITWTETLPSFLILIMCIPINSIISYCTAEHMLAPILMDERIRGVYVPLNQYKLHSLSFRTIMILVYVLIVPLVPLGHFLYIANFEGFRFADLPFHFMIILLLSLAAIFITVYESNFGTRSALKMTVKNLEELEKGNLQVAPVPILTKGEIGIISQSVNVLAKSLRSSAEMFSKAFESSPMGRVIMQYGGGMIINANQSFLKIFGYGRGEIIGRPLKEVGLFKSLDDYERIMQVILSQGQVKGFDMELCARSKEVRMVRLSTEKIMLMDQPCLIATIEDITENKILEHEILTIGDRERQKIGQYLHDDLAPHLIGIEVMSTLLKKRIEEQIVPLADEVEKIRSLIEEAISKTRRLSRGLCPVYLADNGLESLLQEMASNIKEVYGIACTFNYHESILVDDISVCSHIYYIVHEAIYNAIRHSHADRIDIRLLYNDNIATITVDDNGIGINKGKASSGMGLKIMNFRAQMIGAKIDIEGSPEEGTMIRLSFRHDKRVQIARG